MSYFWAWLKAAMIRAIKTFAQTAASLVTVGAVVSDVDWKMVFSAAAVAAVYSLLTSLAGLPEVPEVPPDSDGKHVLPDKAEKTTPDKTDAEHLTEEAKDTSWDGKL